MAFCVFFLLCLVKILLATFWATFFIVAMSSSQVLYDTFKGRGGRDLDVLVGCWFLDKRMISP